MKLGDFNLLTDENIDATVVAHLRSLGFDVLDVKEQGWHGLTDVDLIRRAFAGNRVLLTHDGDFGSLVVLNGEPVVGIVYLRPGHIDPQFTIDTINAVLAADPDVTPPFLLVAKRAGTQVQIRVRHVTP
jgi:predicted nuclease of predicted toxin-antitoxin system